MIDPLLLALPGNEAYAAAVAAELGAERGNVHVRRFPDGESYVRLECDVRGRSVALVCTLHDPDRVVLPLCFAAAAARDLGATRVGLIAPYLAYMRQDCRFQPGEAVTSVAFGALVSSAFDWLVTVDPHLHRHRALADVYRIPATTVTAAPAIAAWIRRQHPGAVVVGPDAESDQWASAVAAASGLPYVVLEKNRRGDREVEVSGPALDACRGRTPVVVDDIVSTGGTLAAVVGRLRAAGLPPPVCVVIHAVFADGAEATLRAAGVAQLVTCDTIAHASNTIATASLVAAGAAGFCRVAGTGRDG